ncbi:hypothetical protein BT69DRAFT_1350015 [Atractiella rhizophila]|nr:hypothetical protein BT69DRAFT_1350015 [Atractiella rhizophila]
MSRFFTKKESTLLPPPEPIEAEDIKLWDILKHLEYPKTAERSYSYSLWLLPNPSLHPILRACALFDAATGYLFEKRYELAVIYTFELSRLFDEVPLETYEGFPLKHQWEVRGKVRRMKEKLPLVWFDLMSGGLFSGSYFSYLPLPNSKVFA